jgi:hypothetical protein
MQLKMTCWREVSMCYLRRKLRKVIKPIFFYKITIERTNYFCKIKHKHFSSTYFSFFSFVRGDSNGELRSKKRERERITAFSSFTVHYRWEKEIKEFSYRLYSIYVCLILMWLLRHRVDSSYNIRQVMK